MISDFVPEDDSELMHQVLPQEQPHHTKQELPQENAGVSSAAAITQESRQTLTSLDAG
jgi:hypothetical protein